MTSRARLLGVLAVVGWALASGLAQGSTRPKRLRISPSHGEGSTRFVLTFTATATTGASGGLIRTVTIRMVGSARAPHACTNRGDVGVAIRRLGLQQVTLSPGAGSAHWCSGTFHGSVEEEIRPDCTGAQPCPQFVRVQTIGTFSFTVGAGRATDPARS